jgi:hypothetical protein
MSPPGGGFGVFTTLGGPPGRPVFNHCPLKAQPDFNMRTKRIEKIQFAGSRGALPYHARIPGSLLLIPKLPTRLTLANTLSRGLMSG